MKLNHLSAKVLLCLALSQTCLAQDLRIVGTNLFDFSRAANATNPGIYRLTGKVVQRFSEAIKIEITKSELVFVPEISRPYPGDPSSMMQTLAQIRLTTDQRGQPRRISPAAAFMHGMDGHYESATKTSVVFLLNFKYAEGAPDGSNIDCFAVPTKIAGYWDFGTPYSGTNYFTTIYQVLPDRIFLIHPPLPQPGPSSHRN